MQRGEKMQNTSSTATHESLTPRRLSNIVSVLFSSSLVFFFADIWAVVKCSRLEQHQRIVYQHPQRCCRSEEFTDPGWSETTSGNAQAEKCDGLPNRYRGVSVRWWRSFPKMLQCCFWQAALIRLPQHVLSCKVNISRPYLLSPITLL